MAYSSQAATFTMAPTAVNRLIQGGAVNDHYDDNFSTNQSDTQTTLVKTTNAGFNAALATNLGALGSGEHYQINSALLVVGDVANRYVPAGSSLESHLMLLSYDGTAVTWNSFDGLGGAGTSYVTANLVTGVQATDSVSWDFTATVRAFLAGTTPNEGIYFSGTGTDMTGTQEVPVLKVIWQLDAIKITTVSATIVDFNTPAEVFASEVEEMK